jgi:hypothetical protein
MGAIRNATTGATQLLEPEHLVGRLASCGLRLTERYVSAQHAVVRWMGDRWRLKDLGSRNGTFLDGVRITPGADYELNGGASIAFGKVFEQAWNLIDDRAPESMVVPVGGGDAVLIEGDLLALPSAEDPQVTIYRRLDGSWTLERNDQINPITSMQTFDVGGQTYRFCASEGLGTTALATSASEGPFELVFHVSPDEEFVRVEMVRSGGAIDLGSRAHNYLLLTLARLRIADQKEGHSDSNCGWVSYEDLEHDPSMAPPQLNIDVFRIRKHFAKMGVPDAANVIERRPRTRQLRIGFGRLSVTRD